MSPILVRPVREQLEHDRVIRLLQAKYKRKFDVAINPGNEQTAPVGTGTPWYPDLVLQERGRKLVGVVEVETAESVNNLEAMSQWVAFGKLRGAQFHLYVPASAIDTTRRLCSDLGISVGEIWAYHSIGDQLRFTLVQKTGPGLPKGSPEPRTSAPKAAVNGSSGRANEKAATPKAAAPKPVAAKPAVPVKKAPAKTAPAKVAPAKPAPVAKKAVAVKKAAPAPKKTVKPALAAKASNGKKKAAPPAKSAKRR